MQKICKDIGTLNNTIKQLERIDTHRIKKQPIKPKVSKIKKS